jgi:hypothetical protein
LLWFGHRNHCILACFLWFKKPNFELNVNWTWHVRCHFYD